MEGSDGRSKQREAREGGQKEESARVRGWTLTWGQRNIPAAKGQKKCLKTAMSKAPS